MKAATSSHKGVIVRVKETISNLDDFDGFKVVQPLRNPKLSLDS